MMNRTPLSLLAVLVAASCTPAGQLYEPVPVELGDPVSVDGDTLYRVNGRGYVLLAGRREALPDIKQALDVAAVRWRGFFGAEPPPATVLIRDSTTRDLPEASVRGLGRGPFVGLGAVLPEARPPVAGPAGPAPTPIRRAPAEPVAEAWVRAFSDSVAGTGRRRGDPGRIPDWLRLGLVELVGGSGMPEVAASRLRNDQRLLSLAGLFSGEQPPPSAPAAERDGRPRRRTLDDALRDPTERFRLESALVLQFLVERGGLTVPRELLSASAEGRPVGEALAAAGISPADPAALEEPWRKWLNDAGAPRR